MGCASSKLKDQYGPVEHEVEPPTKMAKVDGAVARFAPKTTSFMDLTHFPSDIFKLVWAQLFSTDRASLLGVSKSVYNYVKDPDTQVWDQFFRRYPRFGAWEIAPRLHDETWAFWEACTLQFACWSISTLDCYLRYKSGEFSIPAAYQARGLNRPIGALLLDIADSTPSVSMFDFLVVILRIAEYDSFAEEFMVDPAVIDASTKLEASAAWAGRIHIGRPADAMLPDTTVAPAWFEHDIQVSKCLDAVCRFLDSIVAYAKVHSVRYAIRDARRATRWLKRISLLRSAEARRSDLSTIESKAIDAELRLIAACAGGAYAIESVFLEIPDRYSLQIEGYLHVCLDDCAEAYAQTGGSAMARYFGVGCKNWTTPNFEPSDSYEHRIVLVAAKLNAAQSDVSFAIAKVAETLARTHPQASLIWHKVDRYVETTKAAIAATPNMFPDDTYTHLIGCGNFAPPNFAIDTIPECVLAMDLQWAESDAKGAELARHSARPVLLDPYRILKWWAPHVTHRQDGLWNVDLTDRFRSSKPADYSCKCDVLSQMDGSELCKGRHESNYTQRVVIESQMKEFAEKFAVEYANYAEAMAKVACITPMSRMFRDEPPCELPREKILRRCFNDFVMSEYANGFLYMDFRDNALYRCEDMPHAWYPVSFMRADQLREKIKPKMIVSSAPFADVSTQFMSMCICPGDKKPVNPARLFMQTHTFSAV